MSVGLIALLDDVAAMAKLAAASIDDVGAAAAKASAKAAGVVIDDAAVTPRYVTGLTPDRELPIIYRIALGSLKNKLLFLLPAALLLSALAPWALTPLLMLGGAYLCFEGAEKLVEKWLPHEAHAAEALMQPMDAADVEKTTIKGAIRTDFILSAEIMAIALASVADTPLWEQGLILVVVSLLITAVVYGAVALIVKLDDIGLHLSRDKTEGAAHSIGTFLVNAMPPLLAGLTVVGTAAMLWVGGGIVVHGMEELGLPFPGHPIAHLAEQAGAMGGGLGSVLSWLTGAALAAASGLVLGGVIVLGLSGVATLRGKRTG